MYTYHCDTYTFQRLDCFCPAGTVELGNKCVSQEECPTESPEQQCPEGKVYQECGTACPKTCDNKDELTFCTRQCVQGEHLFCTQNICD